MASIWQVLGKSKCLLRLAYDVGSTCQVLAKVGGGVGTTEECFSKEMDIIERMANRILDELSDSNKISLGGALEDCDIEETSPYCFINTLEGSSFRDFFCQFFIDDEVLFTISQNVGLLYEDGQACFIPENPDHVKKQYFYNWGKLL